MHCSPSSSAFAPVQRGSAALARGSLLHRLSSLLLGLFAAGALLLAGCETQPPHAATPSAGTGEPPPQILQGGDVVKLSFPGAAGLDTSQQIRRDGKLNLNLIGEIQAAGKTPSELEKELVAAYSNQLISKEVKVTVVSSSFAVFVTGAVLKPGKIQPDHALTAFEAIMEAGGFDYTKADTGSVRVIRTVGSETQTFYVDMKSVLDGKSSKPFYLQANDTVYIPTKFTWF